MNGKKKILSFLLAGALAVFPVCARAASGGVGGSVVSAGNEQSKVTLSLFYSGGAQAVRTVKVAGTSGSYVMEGVEQGVYVLKATKYQHVPREYMVAVIDGTLVQDVELRLQGDASGDGRVNMGDTAQVFAYARGIGSFKDAYAERCADMTGDGRINMGDVAKIFAMVRYPETPPEIPPLPANPVEDNKDTPLEVGGTLNFDAAVSGGHLSYYNLYRISGTSLTIEDPMAYVIYNGVTYEAEDGVVTVPDLYSDHMNTPVSLAIGNRSEEDRTFAVKLSYPQGHQMNPIPLTVGNVSTWCQEGNSQGVYYSFTASKAGTLNIRLNQTVDCNITITSDAVEGGTRSVSLSDNPDSTALTFKMSEGESVSVCIVMNPQNGFNYPEATVSTTVRFR